MPTLSIYSRNWFFLWPTSTVFLWGLGLARNSQLE